MTKLKIAIGLGCLLVTTGSLSAEAEDICAAFRAAEASDPEKAKSAAAEAEKIAAEKAAEAEKAAASPWNTPRGRTVSLSECL